MLLVAAARVLAVFPIALIAFGVLTIVVPIEAGPPALVGILWVHLALATLLLVPLAVRVRGSAALRWGLAALVVLLAVRVGGEWVSLPIAAASSPGDREIRVVTWNIEVGAEPSAVIAALRAHPADILGLQELTPDVAAAIEADAWSTDQYPYRDIRARPGTTGIGLLSRWPFHVHPAEGRPIRQLVTVDVDGDPLEVVHAHPFPADMLLGSRGIPLDFDPARRNADLDLLRGMIDDRLGDGSHVLVLGDFNTAPSEAAFGRFTSGLLDAHAEVGSGPGWTYRPHRLDALGIGLLRIDLVLGGPGVVPIAIELDCSRRGDHCLVAATMRLAVD